jgi:uncharacterized membrane protein
MKKIIILLLLLLTIGTTQADTAVPRENSGGFLEDFVLSGWFIVIVMFATFGWMVSQGFSGKGAFVLGGLFGLFAMLVMEVVDTGMLLFAIFVTLLAIAVYQKKKGRL